MHKKIHCAACINDDDHCLYPSLILHCIPIHNRHSFQFIERFTLTTLETFSFLIIWCMHIMSSAVWECAQIILEKIFLDAEKKKNINKTNSQLNVAFTFILSFFFIYFFMSWKFFSHYFGFSVHVHCVCFAALKAKEKWKINFRGAFLFIFSWSIETR